MTSIGRRLFTSAASLNPLVFATLLGTNFGYNVYAKKYPKFMPIPCEGEMWSGAPSYSEAHEVNSFTTLKESML